MFEVHVLLEVFVEVFVEALVCMSWVGCLEVNGAVGWSAELSGVASGGTSIITKLIPLG